MKSIIARIESPIDMQSGHMLGTPLAPAAMHDTAPKGMRALHKMRERTATVTALLLLLAPAVGPRAVTAAALLLLLRRCLLLRLGRLEDGSAQLQALQVVHQPLALAHKVHRLHPANCAQGVTVIATSCYFPPAAAPQTPRAGRSEADDVAFTAAAGTEVRHTAQQIGGK